MNLLVYPNHKVLSEDNSLVSFDVGSAHFDYDSEKDEVLEADFEEVHIYVKRKWLYDLIKKMENFATYDKVQYFFYNKYTYNDSEYWYDKAVEESQVYGVLFDNEDEV